MDNEKVDPVSAPEQGVVMQIVRAIVLGSILAGAAWLATSWSLPCAKSGRNQRITHAAATVTTTPIAAAISDTTMLVHSGAMPFCTSKR